MKKYIYLAIALVMGVFTSCTDKDDIEIIQHHDININVNAADLYNSWDAGSFINFLGNHKSYSIGVTTLIYNDKGELCNEVLSTTRILESIQQSVPSLKEGKYTFVTVECMVNTDDNNLSPTWSIDKKELLDSVRVVSSRYEVYWYNCLGLATTEVEVSKNSTNISVTPKAIGCFVDFECENFDKSKYNYLGFYFKNVANGMYLNPKRSENEKYYYEDGYLESNVWNARGYFYSPDGLTDSYESTLFVLENGNINYCFGPSKVKEDGSIRFDAYPSRNAYCNFQIGQLYKAYCYYKGAPDEVETFMGPLNDFNIWYQKFDKTMNPIYSEPCTTWGASVSYVKSFMKGYEILKDIEEGPYSYYMVYGGKYSENYIEYDFETKTSGLYNVYIAILEDNASENDILEMLNESSYVYDRYYDEEDEPYHKYYDDKTYVAVYPNLSDEEGTRYSIVQYMSREMADAEPESSAAKARSVKNVKSNSAKLSFGLSKINKKRILKK